MCPAYEKQGEGFARKQIENLIENGFWRNGESEESENSENEEYIEQEVQFDELRINEVRFAIIHTQLNGSLVFIPFDKVIDYMIIGISILVFYPNELSAYTVFNSMFDKWMIATNCISPGAYRISSFVGQTRTQYLGKKNFIAFGFSEEEMRFIIEN